jgi:hypothetical protein
VTYAYLNCFVAGDIPENRVKWALGINCFASQSFIEGLLFQDGNKMVGKLHKVQRKELAN